MVVWNVDEKKPVATLASHKGWCRAVAFTTDGKHFATGGEDGAVFVCEAGGPKEIKTFKAHESADVRLAFSPDNATLATASDRQIRQALGLECRHGEGQAGGASPTRYGP